MARNYLISITGDIAGTPTTAWLTRDGLSSGVPCKTDIPAVDALFAPASGNTTTAAGGSGFNEKPLANGGGRPLDISFAAPIATARLTDIRAIMDAAVTNETAVTVTIAGDTGSVSVAGIPNFAPIPVQFGRFIGGRVRDVKIHILTNPV